MVDSSTSGTSVILSILAALGVGGWIGSFMTNWMTMRREKAQRVVGFHRQQLEQFYGPLLAMHKEIRARSELRVKLQRAIDSSNSFDMVPTGPDGIPGITDEYVPAIVANVDDEAKTFRYVLMPRYRDMIDTFRGKMWLAEPKTREFFSDLIEFVDVWDKIIEHRLPHSAAVTIGHTEKNLQPFYHHLEEVHDRLRKEVS